MLQKELDDVSAVHHKQHSWLSRNKLDHVSHGILKPQHSRVASDMMQCAQHIGTPLMVYHEGSRQCTGTALHLAEPLHTGHGGETGSICSSKRDEECCAATGVVIP